MDAEKTNLGGFYAVLAWAERNKSKLIVFAVVVAAASLAVSFYVWKQSNVEATANIELSNLRPTATATGSLVPVPASAFLKIVNDYPKTSAAARARLWAAGALFTEGKYAEAKAQFDRFLRDYPASPFRSAALYGNAACLEAQGKLPEATAAFKDIVERRPTDPVVSRAKLALGRLYQTQNEAARAYKLFEDVARAEGMSSLGYQAEMGLEELKRSNPNLGAPAQADFSSPVPALQTNQP